MLIDVQILIGGVLAFVLFNAHEELVYNNLLSVLVGCDTGVDEFHDLADIFGLDDVRYYVRHYITDCLEVLLLELDQSCLEELD